jgi:hypothetical protein
MSLVFRHVGVYLKTLVGVVVAGFLLVFFLANRGNRSELWLFTQFIENRRVSTNLVVFVSLVAGVLLWWLLWWMTSLPGQWRSVRRDVRGQELPVDQDDRGR